MKAHGWRLERNYGNYGAYGWGFGIFFEKTPETRYQEQVLIVRFGPWAVMWQKQVKTTGERKRL